MRGLRVTIAMLAALPGAASAEACAPTDFLTLPLPAQISDPVAVALETAYPDVVRVSGDGTAWSVEGGPWQPMGAPDQTPIQEALRDGDVIDQFRLRYPLDFDLAPREIPWFDPGRVRAASFFARLWFADAAEARASLVTVRAPALSDVRYQVTRRHGVDCQLSAVLDALSEQPGMAAFFDDPGGSFNWRRIAGTTRLSTHSYGIAVDLNAALGGYWRWSGRPEGAAGPYETRIPEALVRAFERHGFIWGGKWHHFDGMHFEYRPELILHARLTSDAPTGRDR